MTCLIERDFVDFDAFDFRASQRSCNPENAVSSSKVEYTIGGYLAF
jgi:hypothetical protein